MRKKDWDVLRLYLLREAARNECSRVCLTNACLKKILNRKRIHYSEWVDLARFMLPIFEIYAPGTDLYGVKTNLTFAIEKGKAGKVLRVESVPTVLEMKKQLGIKK